MTFRWNANHLDVQGFSQNVSRQIKSQDTLCSLKANKIIYHFSKNKKKYPFTVTISSLYTFFTKLMKFHFYVGRLSDQELAKKVGVHTFFLKQYHVAARNYSKNKLARIFSYLREYDLKSKGLNTVSTSDEELLKEMIFKILH